MLRGLHKSMSTLNAQVARAVDPTLRALFLNSNELNKLAMDEEEKIAKEHVAVYENVVKQRMKALEKMSVGGWMKERREAVAKERGVPPKKTPPIKIDTGLTPKEEVIFLSTFAAPQSTLEAHGIVTKLHTESELEAAQSALESSDSWEVCDRCGTRFQVFADRRLEDGALTAGGVCKHHWGKRVFPSKKASRGASSEPTRLSCCNGVVGSPGCVDHDTHVFKISDTRRMSLVMSYMETPKNDKVQLNTAVSFDCEMGYTTLGLELIRLTVVSWPCHKILVDVLVEPLGHVLDLNTRFSGVTPDSFLKAKSYDPGCPKPNRFDLRKVDSPYVARDLFLSHVSPTTYVIGHAIENDLNVIRLIHPAPAIIDTMILYPHHQGLPYRNGLRSLAKKHLNLDIQQGGASGHDSYEDAKTTGELVRAKIASDWQRKKSDGWTITDDGVHPPLPDGLTQPPTLAPPAPPMIGMPTVAVLEGSQSEKRKLQHVEGSEGGGDEQPAKKQA
jgi:RNA exonuclease 1